MDYSSRGHTELAMTACTHTHRIFFIRSSTNEGCSMSWLITAPFNAESVNSMSVGY